MLESKGTDAQTKMAPQHCSAIFSPKPKSDDQNFTVIPEYTVDSVQLPLLIVGEMLHTVLVE
jgi:hypothetical protein